VIPVPRLYQQNAIVTDSSKAAVSFLGRRDIHVYASTGYFGRDIAHD